MVSKDRSRKKASTNRKYTDDELINSSVFDHITKKKIANSKSKTNKSQNKIFGYFIIGILVFGSLLAMGVFSPDVPTSNEDPNQEWINYNSNDPIENQILIYSSPDCSCCTVYVSYMEDQGYSVDFRRTAALEELNDELGIPADSRSCHTTKLGNYFVVGHIPIEVINNLLDQSPQIDGISLPGMPAGSPGMPGEKAGPFIIQAISGGVVSGTFMSY